MSVSNHVRPNWCGSPGIRVCVFPTLSLNIYADTISIKVRTPSDIVYFFIVFNDRRTLNVKK